MSPNPLDFRTTAKMIKLQSPRGWLGCFVGCESEAMYHIYSPEKHKIYRIGVARVEDGEGLDDSQDGQCLEDRVRTRDADVPEHPSTEDEDETTDDDHDEHDNDDGSSSLQGEPKHLSISNTPTADVTTLSQHEREDADDEEEDGIHVTEPAIRSKYFKPSRHAGVAKCKVPYHLVVPEPKSSSHPRPRRCQSELLILREVRLDQRVMVLLR